MRVLLVEDDPGIARFLQRGLAVEGYQVDWVTTAQEALSAPRDAYALAILDLGLPDLDGLSVCRAWQRHHPQWPVLILSARDAVESKVSGLDAGAEDYLTKPFAFEELLARLRVLGRRQRQIDEAPEELRVGDLTLIPATRQVFRLQQPIVLTEREFLLLEYLMRHAGRVVCRERILDSVWGGGADITENAVDVYVGYLRRKLEAAGSRLIHTVRGVGFKLVAAAH